MKTKADNLTGKTTMELRDAIRKSELTQNEIARRAGIDRGMVSRFVNGERGMTLATATKVADILGLELKLVRKRKKDR